MNSTVWKYTIPMQDESDIALPVGAQIIDVREQNDQINMWVWLDPEAPTETRHFGVFGTGHPIPAVPLKHLGTAHLFKGQLVFHVFEYVK